MRDGIYHVTFASNADQGEGLVVLKGSSINGGDWGYTYTGPMKPTDTGFSTQLTCKRWNKESRSIFGTIDEFVLNLDAHEQGDGFTASGGVKGSNGTIKIRGTFIAPAA